VGKGGPGGGNLGDGRTRGSDPPVIRVPLPSPDVSDTSESTSQGRSFILRLRRVVCWPASVCVLDSG